MIHSIDILETVRKQCYYKNLYITIVSKVNPTWTDKIKNQIVLSYSCLPVPSLPL